jgi:hypothetical protein
MEAAAAVALVLPSLMLTRQLCPPLLLDQSGQAVRVDPLRAWITATAPMGLLVEIPLSTCSRPKGGSMVLVEHEHQALLRREAPGEQALFAVALVAVHLHLHRQGDRAFPLVHLSISALLVQPRLPHLAEHKATEGARALVEDRKQPAHRTMLWMPLTEPTTPTEPMRHLWALEFRVAVAGAVDSVLLSVAAAEMALWVAVAAAADRPITASYPGQAVRAEMDSLES